jgi:hypothetical protein
MKGDIEMGKYSHCLAEVLPCLVSWKGGEIITKAIFFAHTRQRRKCVTCSTSSLRKRPRDG